MDRSTTAGSEHRPSAHAERAAAVSVFGGRTPTRVGELSLEERGIAPIEPSARYGSAWRLFAVWFAPNVETSSIFLGAIAASLGLGLAWGAFAIVLGTVLGAIPVALLATLGPRTGTAQLPLARLPFGQLVWLPALVQWLSAIAWDGLVGLFGAEALSTLVHLPFWLAACVVIGLEGLLAVLGYELVALAESAASVLVGAAFIVLSVAILEHAHLTALSPGVHGSALLGGVVLMTTLSFSDAISWASYASDYARYLPTSTPPRSVAGWTFLGLVASYLWMEGIGLAAGASLTTQTAQGVAHLVGGGALGAVELVAMVLGAVVSNAMNDYTGSLAAQTAGLRLRRPLAAGIVMLAALALVLWLHSGTVESRFQDLLLFAGYWVAPFAAIVLVDAHRRGEGLAHDATGLLERTHRGWAAVVALAGGFVVSIPFMNATGIVEGPVARWLDGGDTAYYVGFIAAGIIYLVLDRKRQRAVRSPAD
jgi:NCS1 family nucleobase:cation symporter-1